MRVICKLKTLFCPSLALKPVLPSGLMLCEKAENLVEITLSVVAFD
jgi:hypothetical protein